MNVAWFAVLTAASAMFGFILGTLCFFVAFLRLKAQASWRQVMILTGAAVAMLLLLSNTLLVELPPSLLLTLVNAP
jgi:hypothetical protein